MKVLGFFVESEKRLSLPVRALPGDLNLSAPAPVTALFKDLAAELCMLLLAFMLPFELLRWYRFVVVVVEVTVFCWAPSRAGRVSTMLLLLLLLLPFDVRDTVVTVVVFVTDVPLFFDY